MSIIASVAPFWILRKSKNDIAILGALSAISLTLSVLLHLNATPNVPDTLFEEHLFRVFTHIKRDIVLTLSNALLWGLLPIGWCIYLRSKKFGTPMVWIVLGVFTVLKTFADDYVLHAYPEILIHPFEWGDVLLGWFIVYSLLAIFNTKGIDYLSGKNDHDKPDH